MSLQAGAAKVCITPPIGVELWGQGVYLERRAEDIHDDLFSRALVLDDGATRIALSANDLGGISEQIVAQARELIARDTSIPADHVIISTTHTHNGPSCRFLRGWGEMDQDVIRLLPKQIAGAVRLAESRLRPARLGVGSGDVPEASYNRVEEGGPIDPELGVVRVDDEAGHPIAVVLNYSAHPATVASPWIRVISAGLSWYPCRTVEEIHDCVCLYTTGAAGDVNSIYTWTGFPQLERVGALLAGEALKVLACVETHGEVQLGIQTVGVELPQELPFLEDVTAVREEALAVLGKTDSGDGGDKSHKLARFNLEWSQSTEAKLLAKPDPSLPIEIQSVTVGDKWAFVAIPAEVFVEYGLRIKAASPFERNFILGYSNGFIGYIPNVAEYERKGYAADMVPKIVDLFPFRSDVGEVLTEAVLSLLRKSHRQ